MQVIQPYFRHRTCVPFFTVRAAKPKRAKHFQSLKEDDTNFLVVFDVTKETENYE